MTAEANGSKYVTQGELLAVIQSLVTYNDLQRAVDATTAAVTKSLKAFGNDQTKQVNWVYATLSAEIEKALKLRVKLIDYDGAGRITAVNELDGELGE